MVQIKIKAIKKDYHVFAYFDDFYEFIKKLLGKLQKCSEHTTFVAFFHLPELSDEQMMTLFYECNKINVLIKGINPQDEKNEIKIIKSNLTSGNMYQFKDPVLLLGSIEEDVYITTKSSLYVVGDIKGTIDFFYDDCKLYASFIDARIRICDSQFQNVTSFLPVEVYYEQCTIKQRNLKEERMWEKQLR